MALPNPLTTTDKPFTISQIKAYIPIQLDMEKLNYDVWRELFETHCSSFGVLKHIDGTAPPTAQDNTWKEHDDLVKMWTYGTISQSILETASQPSLLNHIITCLHSEFEMTDLGELHHFLGISVTRDPHGLFLQQQNYAADILHRANMTNCNPVSTPVEVGKKLDANDGPPMSDPTLYRSLAGALQYLTFTRPDISFAVQQVCLFMHDPRESHYNALKRILRYIKGTISLGLHIHKSSSMSLVAYSDADWAGCPSTRRSTSGYCVFFGDNLVSWSSKRQQTTSRSSAEAEYRGVANVVAETTWIRTLLLEMKIPIPKATIVYCDNVSAIYMSSNPVQHQ